MAELLGLHVNPCLILLCCRFTVLSNPRPPLDIQFHMRFGQRLPSGGKSCEGGMKKMSAYSHRSGDQSNATRGRTHGMILLFFALNMLPVQ